MSKRKAPLPDPKVKRTPLRLRAWRKFRGMTTQEELADEAGLSQALISQLENNATDYSGDTLARLAFALNCTEIDLLTRDPGDPEGLGREWDNLSPRERRQLVAIIKGLKQTP